MTMTKATNNEILWDEFTRDGSACASDMGWDPGLWPLLFAASVPKSEGLWTFKRAGAIKSPTGEFYGYEYYSYAADRLVKVFND